MPETATAPMPLTHPRRSFRPWMLLRWGLVVPALLVVMEASRVFVGSNFHALLPRCAYRCAYLAPERLEQVVRAHGIRTIINLRGCSDPWPWYVDECHVTHRLNVAQEDVSFSSGRYPPTHEVRRLVEILDRCEYPILMHCRRGADRTGLVAALIMLLRTDVSLAEARRQMSPRYGHVALGRPANLDHYLDLYSEWLEHHGQAHCREAVRAWVADPHFPGDALCQIELLDPPASIPCGKPAAVRLRSHNLGLRPWQMRPGKNAGIHACYWLYDADDHCAAAGRSGLFDAIVEPGASVDISLDLPSLPPGTYRLVIDMVDEANGCFYQSSSEIVEREVIVTP